MYGVSDGIVNRLQSIHNECKRAMVELLNTEDTKSEYRGNSEARPDLEKNNTAGGGKM